MKKLLATTLFGLEDTLAGELEAIGADRVSKLNRAVSFSGEREMMYRANYHLRTALRILQPLSGFRAGNEDQVYNAVRNIEWEKYLTTRHSFVVDTVLLSKKYRHSGYVSQRVKDGIADRFRERTGYRPSVNMKDPDLRINVHLTDAQCTISLDSSGDSLHRRGYRMNPYQAPLSEVLAAGMIQLSGWNPDAAFLNPMCGSGTLAIEACMMARGLPGGYFRNEFGFQRWPDYDPVLFESIRKERYLAEYKDFKIYASDVSPEAVRSAQQNFASAGVLGRIHLEKADFAEWNPEAGKGLIMINPPYGERLESAKLDSLYGMIGTTLKHRFNGFEAWVLSGNPEALKHIGLKPGKKTELFNGPIRCKFFQYDLYQGSRKIVNKTGAED